MKVTVNNYKDVLKKIDINQLPQALKSTLEIVNKYTDNGNDFSEYHKNDNVKRVVDRAFNLIPHFVGEDPKPASKPKAAPKAKVQKNYKVEDARKPDLENGTVMRMIQKGRTTLRMIHKLNDDGESYYLVEQNNKGIASGSYDDMNDYFNQLLKAYSKPTKSFTPKSRGKKTTPKKATSSKIETKYYKAPYKKVNLIGYPEVFYYVVGVNQKENKKEWILVINEKIEHYESTKGTAKMQYYLEYAFPNEVEPYKAPKAAPAPKKTSKVKPARKPAPKAAPKAKAKNENISYVSKIDPAISIIRSYINLNGKIVTEQRILNLLKKLQRLILRKEITKSSPHSTIIAHIQNQLIEGYNKMDGEMYVEINDKNLAKYQEAAYGYKVKQIVALLSAYVGMQGKQIPANKAEALLFRFQKAKSNGQVSDRYEKAVELAMKNLETFTTKGKQINFTTVELNGLRGLGMV